MLIAGGVAAHFETCPAFSVTRFLGAQKFIFDRDQHASETTRTKHSQKWPLQQSLQPSCRICIRQMVLQPFHRTVILSSAPSMGLLKSNDATSSLRRQQWMLLYGLQLVLEVRIAEMRIILLVAVLTFWF